MSLPLFLPETCPHDKKWEECCLEEMLRKNPHMKREDIVFSPHFGWIKIDGYKGQGESRES